MWCLTAPGIVVHRIREDKACPYGGRRSVTAFVTDPHLPRSLLAALDLTTEPAAFAPAGTRPRSSSPGTNLHSRLDDGLPP